jgi:hypothetical protein
MMIHLRYKISFLILIFLICFIASQAQSSKVEVVKELLSLEQALNTNVNAHDTAALSQIIAPEFQLTGPKFPGAVRSKQWLANCMGYSIDSVMITDVAVSNWGDVAVFRSMQHFYNLKIAGQSASYTESLITDLWIKREEKWRLVTRLSERLPKK